MSSSRPKPTMGIKAALVLVAAVVASALTSVMSSTPAAALTTVTQISAGGETECAVMSGGNAYCWGDNSYGQIGDGTTTNRVTPTLVAGGYTWASISTMFDPNLADDIATTCGVTTGGAGYCWGSNVDGEIGDGTNTPRNTPTAVSGGHTWATINTGAGTVCGITTGGAGYCWGSNFYGAVGDNTGINRNAPTAISGGYTWATIKVGTGTTCGVTTGGAGYCWGNNNDTQVGNGGNSNEFAPQTVAGAYTWADISPGYKTTCGVTTSGAGYCWGKNSSGQVGDNTTTDRNSPTAVSGGHTWAHIYGSFASCGLTTSGAAYCWGGNPTGALGDGTTTDRHVPTAVAGGLTFASISNGWGGKSANTNCGLLADGIAYCWGANDESQIGDSTTTDRWVPTEVWLLYAANSSTTVSVTVDSSFTFTVANQSSACNGESNFVSGAGNASAVALGHLAAGANVSGGQALSVTGNAGGGFAVYVTGTQASQNLRNGSHNWTDVAGSYASPAILGAGERFGYTYKDSTASSSVTNPSSTNFIALTNTSQAVMGSTSSVAGSACMSFDAQTSASTPAGSYTATVIYTAVPSF